MHGQTNHSAGPRLIMAFLHLAGAGIATFFLVRHGISARDVILLLCVWIYLARQLFTSFYLLRRGIGWSEAAQVALFLFIIQVSFGYLGSVSVVPWRIFDWLGVSLYVLGSYLNTGSEMQRKAWKDKPEKRGRLYTGGLFSLSMHINYFGDVLLFIGFALITTSMWAFILPVVMTAMFVFAHIPTLDRHLSQRYGESFDEWSRGAKKFVPFVY